MLSRGIDIGPVRTYAEWNKRGYQVKKGEKGLGMIQPRTVTWESKKKGGVTGERDVNTYTDYSFKRRWFAESQTDPKVKKDGTVQKTTPEDDDRDFDVSLAIAQYNETASPEEILPSDTSRNNVLKKVVEHVVKGNGGEKDNVDTPIHRLVILDLVKMALGEETSTLSQSLRLLYDSASARDTRSVSSTKTDKVLIQLKNAPSLVTRVLHYGQPSKK
jgi:hypothetical protein